MTDPREPRIADEEARAVWRRATEIQAERDRAALAAGPVAAERRLGPVAGETGLPLSQVVRAAEEAGIPRAAVLTAIAERRLADADELHGATDMARWMRLLVEDVAGVEVEEWISAPVGEVLSALDRIVARPDFPLVLEDAFGDDESGEAVRVYRLGSASALSGEGELGGQLQLADARVVVAAVRPERGGTALLLRAPTYDRSMNVVLGATTGALGGGGGAAVGAGTVEFLAGLLGAGAIGGLWVALPAAVAAAGGVGIAVKAFRGLQRWGFRKGKQGLVKLARAVRIEAEGG